MSQPAKRTVPGKTDKLPPSPKTLTHFLPRPFWPAFATLDSELVAELMSEPDPHRTTVTPGWGKLRRRKR